MSEQPTTFTEIDARTKEDLAIRCDWYRWRGKKGRPETRRITEECEAVAEWIKTGLCRVCGATRRQLVCSSHLAPGTTCGTCNAGSDTDPVITLTSVERI